MPTRTLLLALLPSLKMKLIIVLLTILSGLISACANPSNSPNATHASTHANNILVLTDADDRRSVKIHVGNRLTVKLPENASTGFTWAVDQIDRSLLKLESSKYIAPEQAGFVGVRGMRVFTFTTERIGESTLSFKYWRFWQGDSSVTKRLTTQIQITH